MNYLKTFTLILLASSSSLLGMEEPSIQKLHNQSEAAKSTRYNYAYSLDEAFAKEMLLLYKTGPQEIKEIISYLQNRKDKNDNEYCGALFWGKSGTGKSTAALSIAYHMLRDAQWDYTVLTIFELFDGPDSLKSFLHKTTLSKRPHILIIDSLKIFLKKFGFKNPSYEPTRQTLLSFLDDQKKNQNFFFIVTNLDFDSADSSINRYPLKSVQFTKINDPALKIAILRGKLSNTGISIQANVTEDKLKRLFQALPNCTGGTVESIAYLSSMELHHDDKEGPTLNIGITHISRAFERYLEQKKMMNKNNTKETHKKQSTLPKTLELIFTLKDE